MKHTGLCHTVSRACLTFLIVTFCLGIANQGVAVRLGADAERYASWADQDSTESHAEMIARIWAQKLPDPKSTGGQIAEVLLHSPTSPPAEGTTVLRSFGVLIAPNGITAIEAVVLPQEKGPTEAGPHRPSIAGS